MPDPIIDNGAAPATPATPIAPPPIAPAPEAPKPQESIISRVANFKQVDTQASKPPEATVFDATSFDKITSVEDAKKYAQAAYQSFERGYQKKFQDIAELRKTLESQIKPVHDEWTPDRVRLEMQKPSFIAAANDVLKTAQPQEEEFSSLSDSEKKKIAEIEHNNKMLIQQQQALLLKQEDEQLKSKYPNYNPQAVDTITADLLANKIKNTREYIWKAADYEPAVNRAYQLGRQDERAKLNENNQAMSYDGITSGAPSSSVKIEKGESKENFLRRLYTQALSAGKTS